MVLYKFYYFKSGNGCKNVFKNAHSGAACILYDDDNCNGEDGVKKMSPGEVLMSSLEFDVESVSVRKGCSLIVYTGTFCLGSGLREYYVHKSVITYAIDCFSTNILGNRLTGDNHLFHDSKDDMHITLDEDEKLEKFDDNVNSAVCSCVNPV